MRPLQLELEGFTSFKERATLDFRELDLFAVTGPTGAGKSSLVDAMIFALYGQVPRVGRVYRQLISHGAERLSVRFDFATGQERFRIVRTAVARGNRNQVRLEQLVGDEVHPIADRVRDIEREIRRIIGLDYDAFVRSVVLPQGQFDAFLKGEPEQRRKILVSLLSLGVYEEMHAIANRRALDARRESEFLQAQLDSDFADATPEHLAAVAGEIVAAAAELAEIGHSLQTVEVALAVARRVAELRRETHRLRLEDDELASRAANDERELERLDVRRGAIDARLLKLRAELGKIEPDAERRDRLAGIEAQLSAVVTWERRLSASRVELDDAREECARAAARAAAAVERAGRTDAALLEAERAVSARRTRREGALTRHAAHQIRLGLQKGEDCPVCGEAIERLPRRRAPRDLAAAEKALRGVERELEEARETADQARSSRDQLRGATDGQRAQVERLAAQVESDADELSRLGRSIEPTPAGDEAWAARLDRVRLERQELEQALAAREGLQGERRGLERENTDLAAALAGAEARRDEAARRRAELSRTLAEVSRREREADSELGPLIGNPALASIGPEGQPSVEGLETLRRELEQRRTQLSAARARADAEKERIERARARAAELESRHAALQRDASLSGALAGHLRANQFIGFVLEEALRVLAEDGSRHLLNLSMGRYSLGNDDQDFCVVDHWNADRVRSVRTLSGGESFVASLALALALAERVADLSAHGRADATESLFLDEGFSTLDSEALDQVLQAIETLQRGDRMVGVVTHVAALADRLPARVEVSRSPGGATLRVA